MKNTFLSFVGKVILGVALVVGVGNNCVAMDSHLKEESRLRFIRELQTNNVETVELLGLLRKTLSPLTDHWNEVAREQGCVYSVDVDEFSLEIPKEFDKSDIYLAMEKLVEMSGLVNFVRIKIAPSRDEPGHIVVSCEENSFGFYHFFTVLEVLPRKDLESAFKKRIKINRLREKIYPLTYYLNQDVAFRGSFYDEREPCCSKSPRTSIFFQKNFQEVPFMNL